MNNSNGLSYLLSKINEHLGVNVVGVRLANPNPLPIALTSCQWRKIKKEVEQLVETEDEYFDLLIEHDMYIKAAGQKRFRAIAETFEAKYQDSIRFLFNELKSSQPGAIVKIYLFDPKRPLRRELGYVKRKMSDEENRLFLQNIGGLIKREWKFQSPYLVKTLSKKLDVKKEINDIFMTLYYLSYRKIERWTHPKE